jgi:hypothetical protein
MKYLYIIIVVTFFVGCGPSSHLVLDTFPSGAQLIDLKSGNKLGVSPLETDIYYSDLEISTDTNCRDFGGIKAIWVSGATASIEKTMVCKKPTNTFVINRPTESPNIELDISYAKTILQNKNDAKKTQYAKQQADSAAYTNFNQQMQNIQLMQINNSLQLNNTLRHMGK